MAKSIYFCFLEGDPAFFIKEIKDYHIIKCDYDKLLNKVKNEIIKREFGKRPAFRDIWIIVSEQFPCCDGYRSLYTKRTQCRESSFESRLSRDITIFLDTLYQRGPSPEEKLIKEIIKERRKNIYYSETAMKKVRENQLKQLRGRRIY